MDFYGSLFDKVLFPAWESGLRRRPTLALLRYLERTQWLSRDELEAIQVGQLRRIVSDANDHVPFYRDAFQRLGLSPEDLRTVSDYQHFPVLTRELAQESEESRRSSSPKPTILKRTSGTSGRPLTFGYEARSEHWRQAVKLRGYGWAGYKVGSRTVHYWGVHPAIKPPTWQDKAKIQLDRHLKRERYVSCGQRGDEELARVVDLLRQDPPEFLIGYAQGLADLARFVVDGGKRDWPDITVICAAEKVYPDDRKRLEQAFGMGIFETYGSREVMLMASECEAHDGMHTSMENLLVEVAVKEGNGYRTAKPGEVGEVLVTDLHNFAMPFLRYANGDLAVQGGPGVCSCGRGLSKISGIEGRVSETLRDARGGKVAGMMFAVFLAHVGHAVRQFQATQHKDGALTFKFVPGPTFDDTTRDYLKTSIEEWLKGYPVRMEAVQEIPIGQNGKRRVVVVEQE